MSEIGEMEKRREIFEAIEAIRKRVATRNSDLSPEEVYRLAGYSEKMIQEVLEFDRKLAQAPR